MNLVHGKRNTSEYRSWRSMKQRCYNPNHAYYEGYGGRGITVCDRWLRSFPDFLSDMGTKPNGYTLERKDNNGNYDPNNCRWASRKEQGRNKRGNVLYTVHGFTECIGALCERFNISRGTVRTRIARGMSPQEAFTESSRKYTRHVVKGVSQKIWKRKITYVGEIRVNGSYHYLGTFNTFGEAVAARKKAENILKMVRQRRSICLTEE